MTRNIDTLIESDRVMVIKDRRLIEYSHPFKLLVQKEDDKSITNFNGTFARMVISTGVENA